MSVLAVGGDFIPAFVFGPPAHHLLKNCPSDCLTSFRALGEGFFGSVVLNLSVSGRLPLLTCFELKNCNILRRICL